MAGAIIGIKWAWVRKGDGNLQGTLICKGCLQKILQAWCSLFSYRSGCSKSEFWPVSSKASLWPETGCLLPVSSCGLPSECACDIIPS